MGARDYSTSAAANLAIGAVSIAEGWPPANVNNAMREQLVDFANVLLDQGGEIQTTGAAGAYAVALSSAPTAYANNLLFICRLNHDAPGASTMNVSGLGAKDFKHMVDGVPKELTPAAAPSGHRAICLYSSSANAVLLLNSATAGVLYEANGEDLSSNIHDAGIMYPAPGGSYEWYQNENFAILRGSFVVLDEATGSTPPYKGDYGGWMPLLFARNYGTTSAPSGQTHEHPQEAEGTPKVYVRGGLVMREENDSIDLAADRLNFDGAGQITSPPNPADSAPIMRVYSRIAGVDHFNVVAGAGTPKAISGINIATSTITTSTTHGLAVNDRVVVKTVGGTTQLNTSGQGYSSNGYVVRTVPSTTTLTLQNLAGTATNFAGWGAWTSGGTVTKAAAHYGLEHPGSGAGDRIAIYQQTYVPAADYSTTGRFSGYHEFQATPPASSTVLPGDLETALRIRAPTDVSGNTPLTLFVNDGLGGRSERDVKTKSLGDLDPSDRVLYIDQAAAGVGRLIPYAQTMTDNDGMVLTTEHNGYTIYSASNPTRAVFTGPATFPAGLRYRFVSGSSGGQRFVVGGGGQIRYSGTVGTQIQNASPADGDAIVVESISTVIFYVVSMLGSWTVS